MTEVITVVDVIVAPPALIEVVTGEKGDPGPPGPAGIPGPHAASHDASGADPVDLTALAGYPGGTTFLRADATFAAPAAGLPTGPVHQVLTAQGVGVAPVFRSSVILRNQANDTQWELRADGTDFIIDCQDAAGVTIGARRLSISAYNGNLSLNSSISNFEAGDGIHAFFVGLANAPLANHGIHQVLGNLVNISDSTTNTPGAVIAGGGAFNVLARWNGANWIVVSG